MSEEENEKIPPSSRRGIIPIGLVSLPTNSRLAGVNLVRNTFLILVAMFVLVFIMVMVLAMVLVMMLAMMVLLVTVVAFFPVFAMVMILPKVVTMTMAMTVVMMAMMVVMMATVTVMTAKANRIKLAIGFFLDRVDMTMLVLFFVVVFLAGNMVVMTGNLLFDQWSIHVANNVISSNDWTDMSHNAGENQGGDAGQSDRGTTKRQHHADTQLHDARSKGVDGVFTALELLVGEKRWSREEEAKKLLRYYTRREKQRMKKTGKRKKKTNKREREREREKKKEGQATQPG